MSVFRGGYWGKIAEDGKPEMRVQETGRDQVSHSKGGLHRFPMRVVAVSWYSQGRLPGGGGRLSLYPGISRAKASLD